MLKLITIDCGTHGTRQAFADVRGNFAVHAPVYAPQPRGRSTAYTVTHTTTGVRVCDIWGKTKAIELARKLNAAFPEDILTIEDVKAKSERYKAFVAALNPILVGFMACRVAANEY